MAEVIRFPRRSRRRFGVYFSRYELNQLLSLYSRHVASGEWRDYAIDHRAGVAAFSVFRRSAEGPAFTVSKTMAGSRDRHLYTVMRGAEKLKQADSLAEVLTVFEHKLRLVSTAH